MVDKLRCRWAQSDPLMAEYHDKEWGRVVRDSRQLWEMLMLEGFQAGLSWQTVLHKREGFRKVFYGFDPNKVAEMTAIDVERLMQDPSIIRSRAKIEATIQGAKIFEAMKNEAEDFGCWVWSLHGEPVKNSGSMPCSSATSSE